MKHAIRVVVCLLLFAVAGFSQEAPKAPEKSEAAQPEKKKVELNAEQKLVIREAQLSLERLRLQYQAERERFEKAWQERLTVEERAVATIALEKLREAGGDPGTHDLNDSLIVIERARPEVAKTEIVKPEEKKPEAAKETTGVSAGRTDSKDAPSGKSASKAPAKKPKA